MNSTEEYERMIGRCMGMMDMYKYLSANSAWQLVDKLEGKVPQYEIDRCRAIAEHVNMNSIKFFARIPHEFKVIIIAEMYKDDEGYAGDKGELEKEFLKHLV